ncbi:acyltransferase [Bacteroides xylanisolvens]|nr:acyltransferase [Bacteroides xylanisolvens]
MLKLKCIGVQVGSKARFCGDVSFCINRISKVVFGKGLIITGGYNINALSPSERSYILVRKNTELIIGNNCGFSSICISVHDSIRIGNNVIIGANTRLNDSNDHCINYLERRMERECKDWSKLNIDHAPIVIEDDVFIGAHCIISKGITIGARSIVAAGSVVVKSIPSDEVWGGNPAKFIKKVVKLGNEDYCISRGIGKSDF